ncbi:PepSY domain-containing protein [Listeria kieliensis]|uniref:Membrane protein n=1 Tax=Listeria kieliensis TaxID=1621700 RepID=A0A3D8TUM2_9LIST|nr:MULTISPECIES: PepSY domain-containing protein [Listeria]RDX02786.1 membrane protein [Listeria kieliensis]
MDWKAFVAGAFAGAAAGHFVYHYVIDDREISGDAILENVKNAFKKEGPIEGSWIQLKKQHYKKYAIDTFVYHGGITAIREGEKKQFEFIADAKTGTIIDIYLT